MLIRKPGEEQIHPEPTLKEGDKVIKEDVKSPNPVDSC